MKLAARRRHSPGLSGSLLKNSEPAVPPWSTYMQGLPFTREAPLTMHQATSKPQSTAPSIAGNLFTSSFSRLGACEPALSNGWRQSQSLPVQRAAEWPELLLFPGCFVVDPCAFDHLGRAQGYACGTCLSHILYPPACHCYC